MRVRGSKRRVRLTEVELEPSEQKPMLRIAPAAASLIWLGSIALATAIYMEWLPARALFEPETATPSQRPRRSERLRPQEPPAPPRPIDAAMRSRPAPPVMDTRPAPATGPAAEPPVSPPETAISTPSTVPESSRTIRGSYYSEDSSWAAGW
ncbi:MAG TPA: hypothetical protein VI197_06655 [Polyangiaceae bacterium]